MKVALVGLGAIGRALLSHLAAAGHVEIVGALVAHADRARECRVFASIDALLAAGSDVVVECARQHVLAAVGPRVLAEGRSLIVSSVGAFADPETERAFAAAQSGASRLVIPAGALAGMDALAAARSVGIQSVRYTRRAAPATWLKSGAISDAQAASIDAPYIVFEGDAREAARRYPKNANVTATIALAGIGFERTRVTLLADPAASANVHVIETEGAFGRVRTEVAAAPLAGSTSSALVAASLARAVLSGAERIAI